MVIPKTIEEIIDTINLCKNINISYYVIGNGSNLLVGDKGYDGVIIKINGEFSKVNISKYSEEDNTYLVRAEAGISLSKLADKIAEEELKGFEFASGIPGTVGGAVTMNAGAYGGEIKDCIYSVTVLDQDDNLKKLYKDDLELAYRSSVIQKKGYVALEAEFIFEKGNYKEIIEKMTDLNNRRKEKQPLEHYSAGSTFKRPEGYYAGKLIMDSELAGYLIGGAQVSTKHCGFIINTGKASAKDLLDLIEYVKEVVYNKYGVELEREVKTLGNF